MLGTYGKSNSYGKINASAQRLPPTVMPERWPQVCRIKILFGLLPNNWFFFTTNSMKCVVNWIPLNTRVRLTQTHPNLTGSHEFVGEKI